MHVRLHTDLSGLNQRTKPLGTASQPLAAQRHSPSTEAMQNRRLAEDGNHSIHHKEDKDTYNPPTRVGVHSLVY